MDEDISLAIVTIVLVIGCGVCNIFFIWYRTIVNHDDEYTAFQNIV